MLLSSLSNIVGETSVNCTDGNIEVSNSLVELFLVNFLFESLIDSHDSILARLNPCLKSTLSCSCANDLLCKVLLVGVSCRLSLLNKT